MPEKHRIRVVHQNTEALIESIMAKLKDMRANRYNSTSTASHSNPHLREGFMQAASADLQNAVRLAESLREHINSGTLSGPILKKARAVYKQASGAERKNRETGNQKHSRLTRLPKPPNRSGGRASGKAGRTTRRMFR